MSEAYLGDIRIWPVNFAPVGWALCDGSLLRIADYQALYSLIGITYGGDGVTNFALPDLRGRIPVHRSDTCPFAAPIGTETVQLTANHLPAHTHAAKASTAAAADPNPSGKVWAVTTTNQYATEAANVNFYPGALMTKGSSAGHDNMMPFLALNFIICTEGLYPDFNY